MRLLAILLPVLLSAAEWTPATWRTLPALQSQQAGWTATVCPAWGRLVSLRSPDGTETLRVPDKPLAELRGGPAGGHMVWLCPQKQWGWPPPEHWEYSAGVPETSGADLTLTLPAGTAERPGLVRRYAWTADGLRCSVAWRGPGRWYALQVFQVRGDAEVRLTLQPTAALPHGFAVANGTEGDKILTDRPLPQPGLVADGADARVWRGSPFQKFFLPYQPIRVQVGTARFQLERIASAGVEAEDGKPTMIFTGALWDMIEIEQASPYLDASSAPAEASVVLRVGM